MGGSIQASIVEQQFSDRTITSMLIELALLIGMFVNAKLGVSFFSHESPCHSGCIG